MNPTFWSGTRVLVTGHTGFKGSWLSLLLEKLGARAAGFGLAPDTDPAMFHLLEPWPQMASLIGDVTDPEAVAAALASAEPEIVIHMAAQSLVRRSYAHPVTTFSTNVMGTVTLLEAMRHAPSVGTVLVVTSDKVYRQDGRDADFDEADPLGGSDPYSASKAAQELVAATYAASYLGANGVRVATARSGNVIGGGDWAADRLVPDFFRAVAADTSFELRYPEATRPWQHVLDPLRGYLDYAEKLHRGDDVPASLNFGPGAAGITVAEVIAELAALTGTQQRWARIRDTTRPEHPTLGLDSTAAAKALDWHPLLGIGKALAWTAEWYTAHRQGADMRRLTERQIEDFFGLVP